MFLCVLVCYLPKQLNNILNRLKCMNVYVGSAKIGKDGKINVPRELMREFNSVAGDKLIFTKSECGIVVTKNGVP